ncbi:MAG TPA: hypothetical protein VFN61_04005 [Acidimicrobiales bacterium]|nr:hypothetical protein [Acidimicrobiales bacterium]
MEASQPEVAGAADTGAAGSDEEDVAGEPACFAHLVCPFCGGVLAEGHGPGCEHVDPTGPFSVN